MNKNNPSHCLWGISALGNKETSRKVVRKHQTRLARLYDFFLCHFLRHTSDSFTQVELSYLPRQCSKEFL